MSGIPIILIQYAENKSKPLNSYTCHTSIVSMSNRKNSDDCGSSAMTVWRQLADNDDSNNCIASAHSII